MVCNITMDIRAEAKLDRMVYVNVSWSTSTFEGVQLWSITVEIIMMCCLGFLTACQRPFGRKSSQLYPDVRKYDDGGRISAFKPHKWSNVDLSKADSESVWPATKDGEGISCTLWDIQPWRPHQHASYQHYSDLPPCIRYKPKIIALHSIVTSTAFIKRYARVINSMAVSTPQHNSQSPQKDSYPWFRSVCTFRPDNIKMISSLWRKAIQIGRLVYLQTFRSRFDSVERVYSGVLVLIMEHSQSIQAKGDARIRFNISRQTCHPLDAI